MTLIPGFDIAQHVKVEMYLPTAIYNPFILGISLMGGNDVLDGDLNPQADWAWLPIEATVSEVNISVGGSVQSNLYFQPDSGTLDVSLQSYLYDPSINSAIRAGAQIRVRLDDGLIDETLFKGFVDTIDVQYYPENNQPNIIRIKAFDAYKRLVNTRLAVFDTTDPIIYPDGYATPLQVLEEVVFAAGYAMDSSSDDVLGQIPSEYATDTIASNFINDAVQVGLGLVWINQATTDLVLRDRPTITTTIPAGTYTVGNNHGDPYHLCMSDIEVAGNADAIYNSLKVSLASDPATYVVLQDEGNIALFGETTTDVSLNTTTTTELNRWGLHVFNQAPTKLVQQVTTPAIDRQGNLTAAATMTPGTLIGVKYTRTPLDIDAYYTTTRITHSIDPNNWFTTMELWKGQ